MVKELRIEKNLTQEAFGKILEVTGATVSRWKTGDIEQDYKTLMAISEFFKVSSDYVLGLED